MAVKRIQQYKPPVQEPEVVATIPEVVEEVVVVEEKKPSTKKSTATKKPIKPKTIEDDFDTIVKHINRCLGDGECDYEISGEHTDARKMVKEVVERYRAEGYSVSLVVVSSGYLIKIRRA